MTGQPDPGPLETVYTVAEIAALLRVSRVTVGRLITENKLGALQVRRGYRITKAALETYIADNTVRVAAPALAAIP